ncbi:MAG TPA: MerR family transcriptional regulator [Kineosporiaceae bacterium]|nr:MerR family transcriptional regulator [Kineosporiaceae bacterium]
MAEAARRRGGPSPAMSIGAVLETLRPEFPDVTISKIRFLEEQGLVEPDRTPSGYRKFRHHDVERLRFVLAVQRDHYLPLRVIRDHLDALDAGLDPPPLPGAPRVPRLVQPTREPVDTTLSRGELADAGAAEPRLLDELESYGLITARPDGTYDSDAVTVLRAAAGLARFGIEPRHLRPFRTAADREAGLVEQVVAPLRRQRSPEAAGRADETAREVAALCLRLHAALVTAALNR